MSLKEKLDAFKTKSGARLPEEAKKIMDDAAEKLADQGLEKSALTAGDKIPDFTLKNTAGKDVNVYDLLGQGPLIINFYRGSWCPYCNLELKAYQELLPQIKEKGGSIISISPDLPEVSSALAEKLALGFDLLSDLNHQVARQFGLVFTLDDRLLSLYKEWGMDLAMAQGNESGELPFPATFVVDREGTILYAQVSSDYTKRLEPAEALAAL